MHGLVRGKIQRLRQRITYRNQSFSIAGKRLGFRDDTRGTLFFEVARIAEAKRPAFLLLENVPGLLSHDGGRTFETILTCLVELGYGVEWCVHNSAAFGVPQQRRRLYIVASLGGKCTGKVFPLSGSDTENLKEIIPGSQGSRVYDPAGVACTQCAGSGGWGGKTGLYLVGFNRNEGITEKLDVAHTINASDTRGLNRNQTQNAVVVPEQRYSFIDLNPDPVITNAARCLIARYDSGIGNRKGESSGILVEDAPRAILTPDRETVRQQGRRIKEPNEPMFTVTATDKHGIVHHGRIRKLMPIETWRLQGFTDEQFYKAQSTGLSDGRLYKMAGNAVSVPVISAIGRKIKKIYEERSVETDAESC
ncbi:MAG: DNA (cytosine-5-)-methyltransferase [Clostridia bacterium]|nr:DNA (cytosine-5-)-methyltransferase [Clostridia bacterium]